jgi:uncharacterized protein YjbJ (UPF0337 family)
MNKDRAKGAYDEVVGSAKRKAGELTDNTQLQVEGMVQQVKGKVENAWGKAKDVVHEANQEAEVKHETRIDVELECSAAELHDNKPA